MTLKIYGLDCSGTIYNMTHAAGLSVVPGDEFKISNISSAEKWTNAFKASADYKDLEMKDMGQLPPGKINNGDVILWGGHGGVFLYGWFYQSNGTGEAPGCQDNLQPGKGPRMISLADVLSWRGLGSYKVFRVIHEHNYTLQIEYKDNIACGYEGQIYQDAVEVDVKVKEEEVSVSNIVNHIPNISPRTIPIVGGCDLTCDPGSLGVYNVISGSGSIADQDGNYRFEVDLVHAATGTGGFGMLECPGAPPIVGPGPTTVADHTENFFFILADSVQRQGTPTSGGYGVFITLTPK
ncbi:MAG: hypothetical protein C0490_19810 [Marivirga sp.]|nr:hypothetical protein [Marivirga sp.]